MNNLSWALSWAAKRFKPHPNCRKLPVCPFYSNFKRLLFILQKEATAVISWHYSFGVCERESSQYFLQACIEATHVCLCDLKSKLRQMSHVTWVSVKIATHMCLPPLLICKPTCSPSISRWFAIGSAQPYNLMYQMAHMGNFLMHDQLIVIFSMSSPSNTAGYLPIICWTLALSYRWHCLAWES